MSFAQQRQIDLLKKQVSQQGERLSTQDKEIAELNRKMDLLLNQFQTRMAAAIDKVIGEGIEVEQSTESQLKELIHG